MIGEGRTRMGKYRVGIIGCGGIGRKHANAYAQMENVDLVAGANPSDRREAKYRFYVGTYAGKICHFSSC
jgi:predicted dehydrogenase